MVANRSQIAPCNGVELADTPITGTGAKDWVSIPNGKVFSFQPLLNGAGGADCTIEIQACAMGGEASPTTLVTFTPADTDIFTAENEAYDRVRMNVTAFTSPAGDGSDVLVSARA